MEDYKPNSHRSKETAQKTEKKVEKVVRGTVKTRKKNGLEKAKGAIFSSVAAGLIRRWIDSGLSPPAIHGWFVCCENDSTRCSRPENRQ